MIVSVCECERRDGADVEKTDRSMYVEKAIEHPDKSPEEKQTDGKPCYIMWIFTWGLT